MSTRSPRSLLAVTVVLSAVGAVLLLLPQGDPARTPAPVVRPESTAPAVVPAPAAHAPESKRRNAGEASAPAQPSALSQLPPRGEGPAGDAVVQQALDAAWPRDLPAGDERQLLRAGRDLLRADATGIGREKWPGVFPGSGQGLAPAFGTGRFRVQAAIARRDGEGGRAVVHLVWAGADRGGTFTDGRVTDWYFIRTVSRKGASTWTPQPRI
ncbi:hypothetical protein [Streptomyces sp. NBC_00439]|uniref:hypothetical protein n=1 Tax=Streptomyces sp. NBC_00439 TaxID=2903650 RepID=UPI00225800E2|nr:hypothetical protein [Streptomyces sp. NBC_00439]MCX5106936.1 hypothetical protein [Streptomyces sp. NBC_00439]